MDGGGYGNHDEDDNRVEEYGDGEEGGGVGSEVERH